MTIASDSAALAANISQVDGGAAIVIGRLKGRDLELVQRGIATAIGNYATTTRTGSLEEAWDLAVAEAVVVATAAADQAAAIAAVAALDGVYPVWD